MKYDKVTLGEIKEHKNERREKRNIRVKVCRMINQYHSIDNIEATEEEKKDAKKRYRREILKECQGNNIFKEEVRMYLNDKRLWENKRDSFI